MATETILHITTADGWAAAQEAGTLVSPSLGEEGFIHCSTHAQLEATANRIFRGSGNLLLLELDVDRLTAPLKWERAVEIGGLPILWHRRRRGVPPHLRPAERRRGRQDDPAARGPRRLRT
jgi:uncharacterized protein (DUF952 family)